MLGPLARFHSVELRHPYPRRWERKIPSPAQLPNNLADALLCHANHLACVPARDRIFAAQPCPREESSETLTMLP